MNDYFFKCMMGAIACDNAEIKTLAIRKAVLRIEKLETELQKNLAYFTHKYPNGQAVKNIKRVLGKSREANISGKSLNDLPEGLT